MVNGTTEAGYLKRDYNMSIRIAKIQSIDNNKCWCGCGATETLSRLMGMQNGPQLWKTVCQFLQS